MNISLKCAAALLISTLVPTLSSALPISQTETFVYEGECHNTFLTSCRAIGLASGDGVWGMISFDNRDENRIVEADEIVSWDFAFGNALFSNASHTLSGALVLNSEGTGFGGYLFEGLFFNPIPNGVGTIYSGVTGSLFFGALDGWVVKACRYGDRRWRCRAASGGGSYTKVPEPGTLMLFGMGFLAMAAMRRRRSASLS